MGTVLDPFLGTACNLAAIACGRNSVGYEIDSGFAGYIKRRIEQETAGLSHYNLQRVKDHIEFAREYAQNKGALKYLNRHFGFPVMTRQEKELKLPFVKSVEEVDENLFKAAYLDDVSVKKELDLKGISIGKQLCLPGLS